MYAVPSAPATIPTRTSTMRIRIPPGSDTTLVRPEAIPGAAHGEDQLGIARVALDLLAQVADVDVDRARLPVVGAAPQALQQLAPGEHDARARREHHQHLELDERQLHWLAASLD